MGVTQFPTKKTNMKKLILSLTALASLTMASMTGAYAQAKLGSTIDQFTTEGGYSAVNIDGPLYTFENGYWVIMAFFDKDAICQNIDYILKDGNALSRVQINSIDSGNLDQETLAKNKWSIRHTNTSLNHTTNYVSERYMIISGRSKIGDKWYYHREIATKAGIDIATEWANRTSDNKTESPKVTDDAKKVNI
jgi:hypothetical protein